MFEDRSIKLLSYNTETLLAEKTQTILARGIANTRLRDYYDVYMIADKAEFDMDVLRQAFYSYLMKSKGLAMSTIEHIHLQIYTALRKYKPNVISIGASGIICGLLGVYVVIAFHFMGVQAFVSVASSMVLLVLMVFSKHIDSIGHFSGLATGITSGMAIVKLFY
ncbi:MAG: rhomboid family intramembrane serine protease [Lachnospiraceae bacterium]|nr:rhomboid family intramembrane serine protease [Lachnospiraceae bacterium]